MGAEKREIFSRNADGSYVWSGEVPPQMKRGRWVGIAHEEATGEHISILADFQKQDLPPKFEIQNVQSVTQKSSVHSGPATIVAISNYYQKHMLQDDVMRMGDWMIEEQNLDPHHKWRMGSLRIFRTSSNEALPEMSAETKKAK